MPKIIGDVAVVISPDATGFRQFADVALRKELVGFRPEIRLGLNNKELTASLTDLKARIKALGSQLTDLRIGADTKGAEAKVVSLQAKLVALTKQVSNITMGVDTKKLDAALAAEVAKLKLLQQQASKLSLDADSKKAVAKLLDLQKQAARLQKQLDEGKLTADIDIKAAEAKIKALDAEIRVLKGDAQTVRIAAETKAINASIALVKSNIQALKKEAEDIRLGANIDTGKLLAAEAALLGIENIAQQLGKKDAPVVNTAMNAFTSSMGKSTTAAAAGWKLLTGHIALFGGALNQVLPKMFTSVAVWHLLADAVIETVAVWAPAIIAVTAFGVAGRKAAEDVYNRMVAANTELQATGRTLPQLGNGFGALAEKVRPEVYQLFGDALYVLSKRGGAFNTVATGTGRVLDQLAARFVFAVTTGGGVNKFMEHAVSDVSKLGDSLGNLGGIFGAVFRAVPGYAEILLSVGDGITKVLERAAQAAEPVIAFGLALHGAVIYGGVAVTAFLGLVAGLVKVISAFTKFNESINLVGLNALKTFGTNLVSTGKKAIEYSGFILEMARDSGIAAARTTVLGDAMNLLKKVPVTVWAVAAAVALTSLIYAIVQSKDAAQKFNDALQQTIQNAPLANVATTIQQAQAVTAAHLADSTRKLNEAVKQNTVVNAGRAGALNSNGTAIQNLDNATRHYRDGLGQLTDQQRLVGSRFDALAKQYGGNTQALGALNAAGITTAQITDKNADHWAQALIQVDATTAAYKAMGTQAGTLGNDLDVLGRTVTSQYEATQKLNQAWSQFITDVTGTQGTFDTVIQGFETLDTHSGDLKLTLGKLKTTFADVTTAAKNQASVSAATAAVATAQAALNKLQGNGKATADQLTAAHARLTAAQDRLTAAQDNLAAAQKEGTSAIDALTPAGIALNQAFTDQVQNIDKLFASWRTAGLANNLFTDGVKAAIVPMVKYAGGSKEATAQLVALAEEAGYQGPISLQALVKWLGNTHGATQRLKDITNQATIQEALLTGAMQSQADFITTQLSHSLTQAILAYNGVASAVSAYGTAVARSGKDSSDAKSKLTTAVGAIVKSEVAMGDNAQQMAAVVAKTFGVDMPTAFGLVQQSLGDLADKTLPGAKAKFRTFAEVGLNDTKKQADDLWNQLATKLGPKLNAMGDLAQGPAKKKFIDWAENGLKLSQDKANSLWKELVTLQQHIDSLHGKNITLQMIATGTGGVKVTASQQGIAAKLIALNKLGLAAGGFISGGQPGKDSVAAMLMPGEVVVPTSMVNAGAVDHLRGRLPGFAAGGQVGGKDVAGIRTLAAVPSALQEATSRAATADVQAALADDLSTTLKAMIAQILAGDGPAVLKYAESFLHKVPYVWGGSTPAGWDCSGFVSYVYDHFGLFHGRTDAAGLQSWAKASAPTPGGMAFYGTPAHHVGFVVDNHTLLSALGTKWGTTESALNMGDNSGYGIPPQGFGVAGGAPGGGALPKGKLQELAFSLLNQYGWGNQWAAFDALETREAGWNMNAVNPGSGAAGLAQFINGWSEYFQYGGNPSTALGQLTAMMNYIAQRYPTGPNAAWAHEVADNWYGKGGIVGMASGGQIPLGKYLPQLKTAQHNEYTDYAGLRKSYLDDIAHARKGSWTSGHKAGIRSELATLAGRQSAEEAAYDNILHNGTSKANLAKFASRVKAVTTTSRDKDLTHSHPGFTHGLQYWLGVLSRLSQANVAPAYGGTQAKLQFGPWLSRLNAAEKNEVTDYGWLMAAFYSSLAHARPGSWLYKNRTPVRERLYAVAQRQGAEAKFYKALVAHSSGSISDLTALPNRIGALDNTIAAELANLQPALLGHVPGGHPSQVKNLQAGLRALQALTQNRPYNPPWAPGNLGPSHTAPGGVLRFDTGRGVLQPGMNYAWNGTGRPEALSASGAGGGGGDVHLHVHNSGVIASQQQTDAWMQASLNRMARSGYLAQAVKRAGGL